MAGHTHSMTRADQALFIAAHHLDAERVAAELSEGAFTPGIVDADGQTPLHAMSSGAGKATSAECEAIARTLIGAGFGLDDRDGRAMTACDLAVARHMHGMAQAFIRLGSDPTAALLRYASHASHAAKDATAEHALAYLELGADPRARDAEGRGYLRLAQERWSGSSPEILALFEALELRESLPSTTAKPGSQARL